MLADACRMDPAALPAFAPLLPIGVALALGMLVGLQRGWAQRNEPAGSRFAGVRTFGLFGMAGGIGGAAAAPFPALSAVMLGSAAVLVLINYYRMTQRDGSISGTASLASLITLGCGFLAGTGSTQTASAVAAGMVLLLAMRGQLHRLIGRISEAEMTGIARFAVIAVVILPILPDTDLGPYQAWNPRSLWLVVVLVSGFSFAGYLAARLLGPSLGTLATAAAGSMVSSTAVTAALAGQIKADAERAALYNCGIALGSAVMFGRIIVLTGLLAPFALPWLARLALPGLLVSLLAALWFLRAARSEPAGPITDGLTIRNPFAFGPALVLMVLVMVLTLAAHWVLDRFGDAGLATVLALSGMVDVDSAIITMGSLPGGSLTPQTAGLILTPPIVLNTLFKAGTVVSLTGWQRGKAAAAALSLSAVATLAAIPSVL